MATYSYPPTEEIRRVESDKLELLNSDDPFAPYMPVTTSDEWLIRWTVEGFSGGLAQLRGLDVAPQHVERVGETDYQAKPGVYGEHFSVKEEEMTNRAARFFPGGAQGRIDIGDLVVSLADKLLERETRLIRYIRSTLFCTGTFAIADKHGAGGYRHTDIYSVQTYDATTWATVATATPLADFRAVKLLARGKNARFDSTAIAVMNQVTFNNMIANTNAVDLGGQKQNFSPLVGPGQTAPIFVAADLPRIVVWDAGYYNFAGDTFTQLVPNGKVVVLSGPTGVGGSIGEYRMVFQAVTNDTGSYAFTNEYNVDGNGNRRVPPLIEVHRGHNGGPVMLRPGQVVVMDVS